MFDIEIDNMFAVIVFIAAMAGIIGLTAYRMHKKNNGITLDAFLDEHYEHIIGVLQDVVSILLVNIEDYPDKETYEKDIIRLTIEKLDDNCTDFGIDVGMLKLVNKDALAEGIHKILTTENVAVFTSTVPKQVMEENKELYDVNVLEVAEVLDAVNSEIKTNNEATEMEELTTEQKKVSEALDSIFEETETIAEESLNYGIKVEPTDEENSIITETAEVEKLPPRETYYGEKKEKIIFTEDDIKSAEFEIVEPQFPTNDAYTVETADQLADLAKLANDVNSISPDVELAKNDCE